MFRRVCQSRHGSESELVTVEPQKVSDRHFDRGSIAMRRPRAVWRFRGSCRTAACGIPPRVKALRRAREDSECGESSSGGLEQTIDPVVNERNRARIAHRARRDRGVAMWAQVCRSVHVDQMQNSWRRWNVPLKPIRRVATIEASATRVIESSSVWRDDGPIWPG